MEEVSLRRRDVEGVDIVRNVEIPMRDGVTLMADLYRPIVGGAVWRAPLPVLLERTPYNKTGLVMSEISVADATPRRRSDVAAGFAQAGYVTIVQDCRGRYGSGGKFTKYLNEAADGVDTLDWIGRQPWANGKVGTYGLSYGAHVQLAAACLAPPQLACMFLDSGGFADAFHAGIRQGGAFELKQLTWAYKHALLSPEARLSPELQARIVGEDINEWMWFWPWSEGQSPLAAHPEFESYVLDQWRHGDYDAFWQQVGLCASRYYEAAADVPTLLMCSWYDPYASATIENFSGLRAKKRSPVELIMGPWTHGRRSESHSGDVDFGSHATLDGNLAKDYDTLRLDWFDRWLKRPDEAPPALAPAAPIRIFMMGGGSGRKTGSARLDHGGRWRSMSVWPSQACAPTQFYFTEDGGLTRRAPTIGSAVRAFCYDPDDPVPTIGGAIASGEPVMRAGAFDQVTSGAIFGAKKPYGPLADRQDVLVFQTEPLDSPIELCGPLSVTLHVSSDRPDTDFTVKLIDVHPPSDDYPDGYAMNLTHGILRARYRESWSTPAMMEAGSIYRLTIEMFPTANRFAAGHRIRLDISSSNFPHFDPNPNTGLAQGVPGPRLVAHNRVHLDAAHPSHVSLPVLTPDIGETEA